MRILSCGIIGLGSIGSLHDEEKTDKGIYSHAGAYMSLDGFSLEAFCDTNKERAHNSGIFWGVNNIYTEIDQFLSDSNIDIVSVCTPDNTHYTLLKKILEKAVCLKAILTEKPLSLSYAEATELESLALSKNIFLEINNQRRAEPMHQETARMIKTGELGSIQAVCGYYVKGLFHIGSTMLDTLRMLLGDVVWVMALPPFGVGSYGVDYSTDFVLGFANGTKAVIQSCDKESYTYSIFEIDIVGNIGRIRITDNGFRFARQKVVDYRNYSGFKMLSGESITYSKIKSSMLGVFKQTYDAVMSGRTGFGDFAVEALEDVRILEKVRQSEQMNGLALEC